MKEEFFGSINVYDYRDQNNSPQQNVVELIKKWKPVTGAKYANNV